MTNLRNHPRNRIRGNLRSERYDQRSHGSDEQLDSGNDRYPPCGGCHGRGDREEGQQAERLMILSPGITQSNF